MSDTKKPEDAPTRARLRNLAIAALAAKIGNGPEEDYPFSCGDEYSEHNKGDPIAAEMRQITDQLELSGFEDLNERDRLIEYLDTSNRANETYRAEIAKLKSDIIALSDALIAERIEREAAQRTIDRLGGFEE